MAIALAILAALFYLGRNYFTRVQLELLTQANPIHVAAVAALFLLTRLLTGRFLQIALAALGHHISLIEAFLVTMLRVYTGLLVPRGIWGGGDLSKNASSCQSDSLYGTRVATRLSSVLRHWTPWDRGDGVSPLSLR